MQILNHNGFEKRILYNAAKNYSTQLLEGEQYHLLNPIIALTIVDFIMFEDSDKVISKFKLIEKERFIDYSDDLEMVFIELPKFTKELNDLSNIKEQWIYFIKNAGSLEYIPDNMPEAITSAFETSNVAGLSKEELEIQYKKKEFISIQKSSILLAEENGMKKGKAEGITEGMEKAQIQMVQEMLKLGLELPVIKQVSHLSKEEIEEIANFML